MARTTNHGEFRSDGFKPSGGFSSRALSAQKRFGLLRSHTEPDRTESLFQRLWVESGEILATRERLEIGEVLSNRLIGRTWARIASVLVFRKGSRAIPCTLLHSRFRVRQNR